MSCTGHAGPFIHEWDYSGKLVRWRAELLQYYFTIWHRNAKWIVECDFLSRYNMGWDQRREEHNTKQRAQATKMATGAPEETAQVSMAWVGMAGQEQDQGQPFSNIPINIIGPENSKEVSE